MSDPEKLTMFEQKFLTGEKPLLMLDEEFLKKHTKVLLRSDGSDRIWKVKLDGDRLIDGWEEFAGEQKFRDGDVLVFRHEGDEVFHVSVSSRSVSRDIHNASSSNGVDTEEDCYIDDDDVESEDDDGEDEDEEDDDVYEVEEGNMLVKKNKKSKGDSSSFILACVTRYSLQSDRLDLSRAFKVSYDERNRPSEIDLVNEKGRKWTLLLAKNSSTGVFYIRRGWSNFCSDNKLSQGDLCKFKVVENGERTMLWLFPQEHLEGDAAKISSVGGCCKEKRMHDKVSKGKEKKTSSPFVKLNYTPSRSRTGQLSLPLAFARENGIDEPGEITLLSKDGRKWSSYVQVTGNRGCGNEWFYLRRGWRELCEANGVKVNDSFVLELIWEDVKPILKFCSKIENCENKGKGNQRGRKKRACETPVQPRTPGKSTRVDVEGRAYKRGRRRSEYVDEKRGLTRDANRASTNLKKLQRKQLESCSVADQVTNVKRGILDTLNTVRRFGAELKTREENLKASLMEMDILGERILGISKILNNNLV